MCGNGIRCVGRYLYERRGVRKDTLKVETKSGIKTLRMDVRDGEVVQVEVGYGPGGVHAASGAGKPGRGCG